MMAIKTLQDLFVHTLSDVYSAEKQLTKALPKLARAATHPDLKTIFNSHLEETQGQIERIDKMVKAGNFKLKRIKCAAMEGLVEEGSETIAEVEKGPVLDAGLIAAAQKVEHYEIATYGTLCALARTLKLDASILTLLQDTLAEEKAADEKLSVLAELQGNEEAAAAG